MKIFKKKSLAMALAIVMIAQTASPVAFAQEGGFTVGDNMIITENTDGSNTITAKDCTHHTHDANCDYTEQKDCTHDHNADCEYTEGKKAIPSQEETPCNKDCLAVDGATEHVAD